MKAVPGNCPGPSVKTVRGLGLGPCHDRKFSGSPAPANLSGDSFLVGWPLALNATLAPIVQVFADFAHGICFAPKFLTKLKILNIHTCPAPEVCLAFNRGQARLGGVRWAWYRSLCEVAWSGELDRGALGPEYTGFKFQCVELARRYWLINEGVVFGQARPR